MVQAQIVNRLFLAIVFDLEVTVRLASVGAERYEQLGVDVCDKLLDSAFGGLAGMADTRAVLVVAAQRALWLALGICRRVVRRIRSV